MSQPRRGHRRVIALVSATVLGIGLMITTASPASAATPVSGVRTAVSTCVPSAAHPVPVVLVHGTFESSSMWSSFQPVLEQAGYCVSAIDYNSLQDITISAGNLSTFVNQVLTASGASKVDIVGHSQGGMMPRYYIKNLGGASKVNKLIAFAPSNYGTTLGGIAQVLGPLAPIVGLICQACNQQVQDSTFLTALNAGGDVKPGITYTVIETNKDEVVTPFSNAFLRNGGTNQLVQDFCAADTAGHIALATEDQNAWRLALNALDPAHAQAVSCVAETNPI